MGYFGAVFAMSSVAGPVLGGIPDPDLELVGDLLDQPAARAARLRDDLHRASASCRATSGRTGSTIWVPCCWSPRPSPCCWRCRGAASLRMGLAGDSRPSRRFGRRLDPVRAPPDASERAVPAAVAARRPGRRQCDARRLLRRRHHGRALDLLAAIYFQSVCSMSPAERRPRAGAVLGRRRRRRADDRPRHGEAGPLQADTVHRPRHHDHLLGAALWSSRPRCRSPWCSARSSSSASASARCSR